VIEAAIAVHRELRPGLLETVYEVVLARELTERGLRVVRQAPVPITYKGVQFGEKAIVRTVAIRRMLRVCEVFPLPAQATSAEPEGKAAT
jgi:GxxExxY protein